MILIFMTREERQMVDTAILELRPGNTKTAQEAIRGTGEDESKEIWLKWKAINLETPPKWRREKNWPPIRRRVKDEKGRKGKSGERERQRRRGR